MNEYSTSDFRERAPRPIGPTRFTFDSTLLDYTKQEKHTSVLRALYETCDASPDDQIVWMADSIRDSDAAYWVSLFTLDSRTLPAVDFSRNPIAYLTASAISKALGISMVNIGDTSIQHADLAIMENASISIVPDPRTLNQHFVRFADPTNGTVATDADVSTLLLCGHPNIRYANTRKHVRISVNDPNLGPAQAAALEAFLIGNPGVTSMAWSVPLSVTGIDNLLKTFQRVSTRKPTTPVLEYLELRTTERPGLFADTASYVRSVTFVDMSHPVDGIMDTMKGVQRTLAYIPYRVLSEEDLYEVPLATLNTVRLWLNDPEESTLDVALFTKGNLRNVSPTVAQLQSLFSMISNVRRVSFRRFSIDYITIATFLDALGMTSLNYIDVRMTNLTVAEIAGLRARYPSIYFAADVAALVPRAPKTDKTACGPLSYTLNDLKDVMLGGTPFADLCDYFPFGALQTFDLSHQTIVSEANVVAFINAFIQLGWQLPNLDLTNTPYGFALARAIQDYACARQDIPEQPSAIQWSNTHVNTLWLRTIQGSILVSQITVRPYLVKGYWGCPKMDDIRVTFSDAPLYVAAHGTDVKSAVNDGAATFSTEMFSTIDQYNTYISILKKADVPVTAVRINGSLERGIGTMLLAKIGAAFPTLSTILLVNPAIGLKELFNVLGEHPFYALQAVYFYFSDMQVPTSMFAKYVADIPQAMRYHVELLPSIPRIVPFSYEAVVTQRNVLVTGPEVLDLSSNMLVSPAAILYMVHRPGHGIRRLRVANRRDITDTFLIALCKTAVVPLEHVDLSDTAITMTSIAFMKEEAARRVLPITSIDVYNNKNMVLLENHPVRMQIQCRVPNAETIRAIDRSRSKAHLRKIAFHHGHMDIGAKHSLEETFSNDTVATTAVVKKGRGSLLLQTGNDLDEFLVNIDTAITTFTPIAGTNNHLSVLVNGVEADVVSVDKLVSERAVTFNDALRTDMPKLAWFLVNYLAPLATYTFVDNSLTSPEEWVFLINQLRDRAGSTLRIHYPDNAISLIKLIDGRHRSLIVQIRHDVVDPNIRKEVSRLHNVDQSYVTRFKDVDFDIRKKMQTADEIIAQIVDVERAKTTRSIRIAHPEAWSILIDVLKVVAENGLAYPQLKMIDLSDDIVGWSPSQKFLVPFNDYTSKIVRLASFPMLQCVLFANKNLPTTMYPLAERRLARLATRTPTDVRRSDLILVNTQTQLEELHNKREAKLLLWLTLPVLVFSAEQPYARNGLWTSLKAAFDRGTSNVTKLVFDGDVVTEHFFEMEPSQTYAVFQGIDTFQFCNMSFEPPMTVDMFLETLESKGVFPSLRYIVFDKKEYADEIQHTMASHVRTYACPSSASLAVPVSVVPPVVDTAMQEEADIERVKYVDPNLEDMIMRDDPTKLPLWDAINDMGIAVFAIPSYLDAPRRTRAHEEMTIAVYETPIINSASREVFRKAPITNSDLQYNYVEGAAILEEVRDEVFDSFINELRLNPQHVWTPSQCVVMAPTSNRLFYDDVSYAGNIRLMYHKMTDEPLLLCMVNLNPSDIALHYLTVGNQIRKHVLIKPGHAVCIDVSRIAFALTFDQTGSLQHVPCFSIMFEHDVEGTKMFEIPHVMQPSVAPGFSMEKDPRAVWVDATRLGFGKIDLRIYESNYRYYFQLLSDYLGNKPMVVPPSPIDDQGQGGEDFDEIEESDPEFVSFKAIVAPLIASYTDELSMRRITEQAYTLYLAIQSNRDISQFPVVAAMGEGKFRDAIADANADANALKIEQEKIEKEKIEKENMKRKIDETSEEEEEERIPVSRKKKKKLIKTGRVVTEKNGKVINISYYNEKGNLDRKDGPASQDFEGGVLSWEKYFTDGVYDRKDGPAVYSYKDGSIFQEMYIQNDRYIRENNQPIIITYYPSKKREIEEYANQDHEYNECRADRLAAFCRPYYDDKKAPSIIKYYESGGIKKKVYYEDGVKQRSELNMDGSPKPTVISYYENGNLKKEDFYRDVPESHKKVWSAKTYMYMARVYDININGKLISEKKYAVMEHEQEKIEKKKIEKENMKRKIDEISEEEEEEAPEPPKKQVKPSGLAKDKKPPPKRRGYDLFRVAKYAELKKEYPDREADLNGMVSGYWKQLDSSEVQRYNEMAKEQNEKEYAAFLEAGGNPAYHFTEEKKVKTGRKRARPEPEPEKPQEETIVIDHHDVKVDKFDSLESLVGLVGKKQISIEYVMMPSGDHNVLRIEYEKARIPDEGIHLREVVQLSTGEVLSPAMSMLIYDIDAATESEVIGVRIKEAVDGFLYDLILEVKVDGLTKVLFVEHVSTDRTFDIMSYERNVNAPVVPIIPEKEMRHEGGIDHWTLEEKKEIVADKKRKWKSMIAAKSAELAASHKMVAEIVLLGKAIPDILRMFDKRDDGSGFKVSFSDGMVEFTYKNLQGYTYTLYGENRATAQLSNGLKSVKFVIPFLASVLFYLKNIVDPDPNANVHFYVYEGYDEDEDRVVAQSYIDGEMFDNIHGMFFSREGYHELSKLHNEITAYTEAIEREERELAVVAAIAASRFFFEIPLTLFKSQMKPFLSMVSNEPYNIHLTVTPTEVSFERLPMRDQAAQVSFYNATKLHVLGNKPFRVAISAVAFTLYAKTALESKYKVVQWASLPESTEIVATSLAAEGDLKQQNAIKFSEFSASMEWGNINFTNALFQLPKKQIAEFIKAITKVRSMEKRDTSKAQLLITTTTSAMKYRVFLTDKDDESKILNQIISILQYNDNNNNRIVAHTEAFLPIDVMTSISSILGDATTMDILLNDRFVEFRYEKLQGPKYNVLLTKGAMIFKLAHLSDDQENDIAMNAASLPSEAVVALPEKEKKRPVKKPKLDESTEPAPTQEVVVPSETAATGETAKKARPKLSDEERMAAADTLLQWKQVIASKEMTAYLLLHKATISMVSESTVSLTFADFTLIFQNIRTSFTEPQMLLHGKEVSVTYIDIKINDRDFEVTIRIRDESALKFVGVVVPRKVMLASKKLSAEPKPSMLIETAIGTDGTMKLLSELKPILGVAAVESSEKMERIAELVEQADAVLSQTGPTEPQQSMLAGAGYRYISFLGYGDQAEVYKVEKNGTQYAMKVFSRQKRKQLVVEKAAYEFIAANPRLQKVCIKAIDSMLYDAQSNIPFSQFFGDATLAAINAEQKVITRIEPNRPTGGYLVLELIDGDMGFNMRRPRDDTDVFFATRIDPSFFMAFVTKARKRCLKARFKHNDLYLRNIFYVRREDGSITFKLGDFGGSKFLSTDNVSDVVEVSEEWKKKEEDAIIKEINEEWRNLESNNLKTFKEPQPLAVLADIRNAVNASVRYVKEEKKLFIEYELMDTIINDTIRHRGLIYPVEAPANFSSAPDTAVTIERDYTVSDRNIELYVLTYHPSAETTATLRIRTMFREEGGPKLHLYSFLPNYASTEEEENAEEEVNDEDVSRETSVRKWNSLLQSYVSKLFNTHVTMRVERVGMSKRKESRQETVKVDGTPTKTSIPVFRVIFKFRIILSITTTDGKVIDLLSFENVSQREFGTDFETAEARDAGLAQEELRQLGSFFITGTKAAKGVKAAAVASKKMKIDFGTMLFRNVYIEKTYNGPQITFIMLSDKVEKVVAEMMDNEASYSYKARKEVSFYMTAAFGKKGTEGAFDISSLIPYSQIDSYDFDANAKSLIAKEAMVFTNYYATMLKLPDVEFDTGKSLKNTSNKQMVGFWNASYKTIQEAMVEQLHLNVLVVDSVVVDKGDEEKKRMPETTILAHSPTTYQRFNITIFNYVDDEVRRLLGVYALDTMRNEWLVNATYNERMRNDIKYKDYFAEYERVMLIDFTGTAMTEEGGFMFTRYTGKDPDSERVLRSSVYFRTRGKDESKPLPNVTLVIVPEAPDKPTTTTEEKLAYIIEFRKIRDEQEKRKENVIEKYDDLNAAWNVVSIEEIELPEDLLFDLGIAEEEDDGSDDEEMAAWVAPDDEADIESEEEPEPPAPVLEMQVDDGVRRSSRLAAKAAANAPVIGIDVIPVSQFMEAFADYLQKFSRATSYTLGENYHQLSSLGFKNADVQIVDGAAKHFKTPHFDTKCIVIHGHYDLGTTVHFIINGVDEFDFDRNAYRDIHSLLNVMRQFYSRNKNNNPFEMEMERRAADVDASAAKVVFLIQNSRDVLQLSYEKTIRKLLHKGRMQAEAPPKKGTVVAEKKELSFTPKQEEKMWRFVLSLLRFEVDEELERADFVKLGYTVAFDTVYTALRLYSIEDSPKTFQEYIKLSGNGQLKTAITQNEKTIDAAVLVYAKHVEKETDFLDPFAARLNPSAVAEFETAKLVLYRFILHLYFFIEEYNQLFNETGQKIVRDRAELLHNIYFEQIVSDRERKYKIITTKSPAIQRVTRRILVKNDEKTVQYFIDVMRDANKANIPVPSDIDMLPVGHTIRGLPEMEMLDMKSSMLNHQSMFQHQYRSSIDRIQEMNTALNHVPSSDLSNVEVLYREPHKMFAYIDPSTGIYGATLYIGSLLQIGNIDLRELAKVGFMERYDCIQNQLEFTIVKIELGTQIANNHLFDALTIRVRRNTSDKEEGLLLMRDRIYSDPEDQWQITNWITSQDAAMHPIPAISNDDVVMVVEEPPNPLAAELSASQNDEIAIRANGKLATLPNAKWDNNADLRTYETVIQQLHLFYFVVAGSAVTLYVGTVLQIRNISLEDAKRYVDQYDAARRPQHSVVDSDNTGNTVRNRWIVRSLMKTKEGITMDVTNTNDSDYYSSESTLQFSRHPGGMPSFVVTVTESELKERLLEFVNAPKVLSAPNDKLSNLRKAEEAINFTFDSRFSVGLRSESRPKRFHLSVSKYDPKEWVGTGELKEMGGLELEEYAGYVAKIAFESHDYGGSFSDYSTVGILLYHPTLDALDVRIVDMKFDWEDTVFLSVYTSFDFGAALLNVMVQQMLSHNRDPTKIINVSLSKNDAHYAKKAEVFRNAKFTMSQSATHITLVKTVDAKLLKETRQKNEILMRAQVWSDLLAKVLFVGQHEIEVTSDSLRVAGIVHFRNLSESSLIASKLSNGTYNISSIMVKVAASKFTLVIDYDTVIATKTDFAVEFAAAAKRVTGEALTIGDTKLTCISNPGNGNCFFNAIVDSGVSFLFHETTNHHLYDMSVVTNRDETANQLRSTLSNYVRHLYWDKDDWLLTQYDAAILGMEANHFAHVDYEKREENWKLWLDAITERNYWADHLLISLFTRATGVYPLFIEVPNGRPMCSFDVVPRTNIVLIAFSGNNHYECLTVNGRSVFIRTTLPPSILKRYEEVCKTVGTPSLEEEVADVERQCERYRAILSDHIGYFNQKIIYDATMRNDELHIHGIMRIRGLATAVLPYGKFAINRIQFIPDGTKVSMILSYRMSTDFTRDLTLESADGAIIDATFEFGTMPGDEAEATESTPDIVTIAAPFDVSSFDAEKQMAIRKALKNLKSEENEAWLLQGGDPETRQLAGEIRWKDLTTLFGDMGINQNSVLGDIGAGRGNVLLYAWLTMGAGGYGWEIENTQFMYYQMQNGMTQKRVRALGERTPPDTFFQKMPVVYHEGIFDNGGTNFDQCTHIYTFDARMSDEVRSKIETSLNKQRRWIRFVSINDKGHKYNLKGAKMAKTLKIRMRGIDENQEFTAYIYERKL